MTPDQAQPAGAKYPPISARQLELLAELRRELRETPLPASQARRMAA